MKVDHLSNRLFLGVAILGPGLAVLGVKLLSHAPGPAAAQAQDVIVAIPSPSVLSAEASLSARQQRLAELALVAPQTGVASPFIAAPDPESVKATVVDAKVRDDTGEKAARIPMTLTSIVAGRQIVAIINGKVRHIGDQVEPGWRLGAIDVGTGTVVLDGPDHAQRTLRLRKAQPDKDTR